MTTTPPPPPPNPIPYGCLPPYLPGSASLIEQLDKRLLIVLRDGRHLIGILRSFDQFSNFILEDTLERKILEGGVYAEVALGLFLIRGDSVVLLGEVVASSTTTAGGGGTDDDDDDDDG
eukprot:CAMPEP_0172501872 /NCGR_PEP_ID=MMETSP1066-20121228/154673_1 /TAXON_ID=671091 /ORGANISM="Coscinodiscus wailesii, Strain CCMP2513" /LENGTH=118 /DNA_ID=CAMNT_0013276911 /DNA_START=265 /DNA_END=618 /DNA_ORIENTATION=+